MLIQTLGPNKGQVQVSADVNADQTTRDKLSYDRRGTPVKTREETEELEGSGGGGGAAGSAGNIPQYANGGAGGDSNYNHEVDGEEQAVGKTVERTKVAPGEVKRQNVAVVVDQASRPPTSRPSRTRCPVPPASTRRAATRSPSPRWRSRSRRSPRSPARRPTRWHGQVGRARPGDAPVPVLRDPPPAPSRVASSSSRSGCARSRPRRRWPTSRPTARPALMEPPVNPVRQQVEEIVEQHPSASLSRCAPG